MAVRRGEFSRRRQRGMFVVLAVITMTSTIYLFNGISLGQITTVEENVVKTESKYRVHKDQNVGAHKTDAIKEPQKNAIKEPQKNAMKKTQENVQHINFKTKCVFNLTKEMRNIKPILTLFTTWLDKPNKRLLHENTICNWMSLLPLIQPVIITNETVLIKKSTEKGWKTLPLRELAPNNRPILKYMFLDVLKNFNTPLVGFSNSDILYLDDLAITLQNIIKEKSGILQTPLLIAGARTNVDNVTFSEAADWFKLKEAVKKRGEQFPEFYASDYFITTRSFPLFLLPEVAVGMTIYDNFMVWYARIVNAITIDTTHTIVSVHQTTVEGNFESRDAPLALYNADLISKQFPGFSTRFGYLQCMAFFTAENVGEKVEPVLVKRSVRASSCDHIIDNMHMRPP